MRLFLAIFTMVFAFGTVSGSAFAQDVDEAIAASFAQELTQAARNGNVGLITDLISKGASLQVPSSSGRYPLHEAAAYGHLASIEVMLANNPSIINIPDAQGYTALHLGVVNRHINAVSLLAQKGANINFPLPSRQTPLHTALRKNYIPIANFLISRRAILTGDEKRLTPLHYAVVGGYIDIAEELIRRGSRVTLVDTLGNTPLHYAAMSGQLDMTAFLLKNGAQTNRRNVAGQTPTTLATSNGYPRVVSLIRIYQKDPLVSHVVFRTDITSDSSGWRDLLPARDADAANKEAIEQIKFMAEAVSERYLSLFDVTVPELLDRPDLPSPVNVRQGSFESDIEFGFRASREIGQYRNLFYNIQRTFEQDVDVRNARVSSLRQRIDLRRDNLEEFLTLFKRDAAYEVLQNFRLENPLFDARTGDLSFLLSATGAAYQQRVSIRPLDSDIVESLFNAPDTASLSVSLAIEDNYIILNEVSIAYDDENIFKAKIVENDSLGNPFNRSTELAINAAEITNKVEESISIDTDFTQQDTDLVGEATIATVRYSNERGFPIKYVDNIGFLLESFVANNFKSPTPAEDTDLIIDDDNDDALEIIESDAIAAIDGNISPAQQVIKSSSLKTSKKGAFSVEEENALEALKTELLTAATLSSQKLKGSFDEEDALEAIRTELLASSAKK